MKIIEIAKYITALGAALGMAYAGVQFQLSVLDARTNRIVAPLKAQVVNLNDRLTLNELKDLLDDALDELFYWRKKAREYPEDEDAQEKLKEAEERVSEIKERIRKLQDAE